MLSACAAQLAHRTLAATRRARQTDRRAQLHHRLIVVSRRIVRDWRAQAAAGLPIPPQGRPAPLRQQGLGLGAHEPPRGGGVLAGAAREPQHQPSTFPSTTATGSSCAMLGHRCGGVCANSR